ncbi:FKBP-type peptidyl-prolyl cis-trans isomerase [Glutamicibacter arilaitensis]|uniref:FKBP-type peptidyl-prolyl cis-trans isomerase n=1 Tax=Glutamicibacter arilaitensis TaxID=256701 RepID=UPI00384B7B7C
MRKVLAVCATASVLALVSCGSGSSSLSKVEVKPAADEQTAPEVNFKAPLLTDKEEAVTVVEGDGADIKEGDTIDIQSGLYKTIDGQLTNENFTGATTQMPVDAALKEQMPELYETLLTSQVGDWIAYAAIDGVQQPDGSVAEPAEGARAERLIVIKIAESEAATQPLTQDEVKKLKDEGKLPTVKTGKGDPAITIPKDTEAPAGLAVDVLEEGTGPATTDTSSASVHYHGVRWEDGKKFDGNFGSDAGFEMQMSGGVIKGWLEGLKGLKEGSKVLLSIPADMAYGKNPQPGQPEGPLVFYVELDKVTESK